MKKIRLLIATGIFPPDIGGPATYSKVLLEELPKRGIDVRLVTYGNELKTESEKLKVADVAIISREQNIFFRYFNYFFTVFKECSWADLVFAQGPMSEGLPTAAACFFRRKRYILKIVGDYAWEQGTQRFGVKELLDDFQRQKYGYRVELMRFLQRQVAKHAYRIIVPSLYLKGIVSQWEIDEKKIEVIYNSIEVPESGLRKSEAKDSLGLNGDIVMTCGRLVPWKGIDTLVRIMPELLTVNPHFKLVVIGDGPQREYLEKIIADLNLEQSVSMAGLKKRAEVLSYMRASDMFVLNSSYEGLSHLLIEAMMVGVPVIASRVGGNVEVVKDHQSGLLVVHNNKEELKTAIIKLWHNRQLANSLALEAKEKLGERFSRMAMVNGVQSLIEKL